LGRRGDRGIPCCPGGRDCSIDAACERGQRGANLPQEIILAARHSLFHGDSGLRGVVFPAAQNLDPLGGAEVGPMARIRRSDLNAFIDDNENEKAFR